MTSVKEHLSRHEYQTAIIQAKNLLQLQPDNGEARLLIGEAYLGARDPVSAEKDLQRALDLGQPHEKAVPLYVRALLEQGKSDAVISEVEKRNLFDPRAVASTKTALGDAYMAKGNRERASAAYQAALAAIPGYPRARLGLAVVTAAAGKVGEALKLADEIIGDNPKFAEALALRSDMLLASGRIDEAKQSLTKAVEVDGSFLPARFSLISLLIDQKAFDQASVLLAETGKLAPRDLRVTYFDALLAHRKGETKRALEQVQQVLKSLPNHVPSLVLAGAVEMRLGHFDSAESHLRRAIAYAPENIGARRLLIASQLRTGRPAQAKEALQPLLARGLPADTGLLLLAGETLLANGDVKQATAYYEAAAKTDSQARAKTRLGQIALATGNTETGFKELEAASEAEADNFQADLALITFHLKRQELDKALNAVRSLEKKQPKNPLTFQMYGAVQMAQKDEAAARKSFEKALELKPNYLPAAQSLALLDVRDKKPDEARRRFESMIAKDPKNDQLYLALATLQAATGSDPKTVGATLSRAVDADPQSVSARVALIEFHIRHNDPKAALGAAQSAIGAFPNDARVVEMLGLALENAGEFNRAIETYTRLSNLSPQSTGPLYRLAGLYARRKEADKAVEALRRVQGLEPRSRDVVPQIVRIYMASDRADDALREVRDLQKREPKAPGSWSLEGDIRFAQQKWPEAEKAFREALRLEPRAVGVAIRLHEVLIAAKKSTEADALAKKWIADFPRDASMRLYLADRDVRSRNYKAAVAKYQAVLAQQPDNGTALNNLAWVLGELNDPGAIGYAERALKLDSLNVAALDTLGMLLLKQGDAGKGVEHLERATKLAPARPDIRLHYAKGLIKIGRKDAARSELVALQNIKEEYPGRSEVAELLKAL